MPRVAERAGVGARSTATSRARKRSATPSSARASSRCSATCRRGGATPREEFHGLWRGLWEFARKHPAAFRFLETHNHAFYLDEASRAVSEAVFVHVADYVRRAQAAGVVRAGEPRCGSRWPSSA